MAAVLPSVSDPDPDAIQYSVYEPDSAPRPAPTPAARKTHAIAFRGWRPATITPTAVKVSPTPTIRIEPPRSKPGLDDASNTNDTISRAITSPASAVASRLALRRVMSGSRGR